MASMKWKNLTSFPKFQSYRNLSKKEQSRIKRRLGERFITFFSSLFSKILSLATSPWGYYIIITFSLVVAVLAIDRKYFIFTNTDYKNIWLNIHASIFEVFILGLVIIIFNDLSAKRKIINKYLKEIEDIKQANPQNAAKKIIVLVFKLIRAGKSRIDLNSTHLIRVILTRAALKRVNFMDANLSNATLRKAILVKANFRNAILVNTNFRYSNLIKADLTSANLTGADLRFAKFYRTNLEGVILDGAFVDGLDWLMQLKEKKCYGWEEIDQKYQVIDRHSIPPVFIIENKIADI